MYRFTLLTSQTSGRKPYLFTLTLMDKEPMSDLIGRLGWFEYLSNLSLVDEVMKPFRDGSETFKVNDGIIKLCFRGG